ncbi:MAG TPA: MFS transporter, partial [Cryptosporangiaceae bacterium]|nr:MFS transporter [Cryptosporangiaceae bacterium]
PQILGIGGTGVLLATLFVFWEQRASEPILPLRLFRNRTFTLATIGSFLIGAAMFGAILYIPLYLQIVKERSATASGLLLLPLMVGIIGTSIVSGRAISRIGRYKWCMVAGASFTTVGIGLHSRLQADTPLWLAGVYMVVAGIGLGLLMQPMVLAAQNSLARRDLGAGTSTATFVRTLGGSVGVAVFGAVFNNRLTQFLAEARPAGAAGTPRIGPESLGDPKSILAQPLAVKDFVQDAFVQSIHTVFLVGMGVAALAIVVTVLMPDAILAGPDDRPKPAERAGAEATAALV